jgi:hypothetical protein
MNQKDEDESDTADGGEAPRNSRHRQKKTRGKAR